MKNRFKVLISLAVVLIVACSFITIHPVTAQADGIPGIDPIITYPDGNGHYTVVHEFTDGRPPELLLKNGSLSRAEQVWLDAVAGVRP